MRNNFLPYLSDETKLLMEDRQAITEEAMKHTNIELHKEMKSLNREI